MHLFLIVLAVATFVGLRALHYKKRSLNQKADNTWQDVRVALGKRHRAIGPFITAARTLDIDAKIVSDLGLARSRAVDALRANSEHIGAAETDLSKSISDVIHAASRDDSLYDPIQAIAKSEARIDAMRTDYNAAIRALKSRPAMGSRYRFFDMAMSDAALIDLQK